MTDSEERVPTIYSWIMTIRKKPKYAVITQHFASSPYRCWLSQSCLGHLKSYGSFLCLAPFLRLILRQTAYTTAARILISVVTCAKITFSPWTRIRLEYKVANNDVFDIAALDTLQSACYILCLNFLVSVCRLELGVGVSFRVIIQVAQEVWGSFKLSHTLSFSNQMFLWINRWVSTFSRCRC